MMTTTTAPSDPRFDLRARITPVKPLPRVVLMGEPGVGKTTFISSAPSVVLIATEDGALGVDVHRLPTSGKCETWSDVITALITLRDEKHSFRWVALDTLGGAEHLCAEMVCQRDFSGRWTTVRGSEGYDAYGKGDKATAQEMRQMLALLDELQQKRGMGVLLASHVGLHKQGNALGADFMKFGADTNKHTWALVCGWADQVGHACRDIRAVVREGENKAKADAIGAERWLVFEGGPGRDAKSRAGYEMPERILLSWDEYIAALSADRVGALVSQAIDLLKNANVATRKRVEKRLGAKLTAAPLRKLGKHKLEQLIGWLMAQGRSVEGK